MSSVCYSYENCKSCVNDASSYASCEWDKDGKYCYDWFDNHQSGGIVFSSECPFDQTAGGVAVIVIVSLLGICCIAGFCYAINNRRRRRNVSFQVPVTHEYNKMNGGAPFASSSQPMQQIVPQPQPQYYQPYVAPPQQPQYGMPPQQQYGLPPQHQQAYVAPYNPNYNPVNPGQPELGQPSSFERNMFAAPASDFNYR
eukprot:CAMPEP_0202691614 /NCGR_PEP_ID=MMETSP1385-20130828/6281_1 /ASSEMBLY_ACC=CAM_ASM_000861 /TAXON_ID=933848 /ORGANISM="Elphidium margaritaceum" /LENGTH=197 /DNA_ID=CAMNT_0049347047 /DNA_START=17 /DNA_END=610 /DNA_ORIENTATION=-